MEAAICFGYGPLPSISLGMPSGTLTPPASTGLYFGFNHSSISVSSGFANRRRRHHFYSTTPGPLAIDRSNNSMPSANEKGGGNKVFRGAIGASLALACALGIIGCSCKMNLKAIAGPKQHVYQKAPSLQQLTPTAPRKMALKSLLDVTVNLASKDGRYRRDVSPGPPSPISGPSPSRHQKSIDQLKEEAVILMKRGQPDTALRLLKTECKNHELSDPESAYFTNMLLIEILICQGKYEEAFDFMRAHDQKISEFDVRPILYRVG